MKIYHKNLISLIVVALAMSVSASFVQAARIPNLLPLASMNNNTQVQITVMGADVNAPAKLYYPTGGSYTQLDIGMTDANGFRQTTVIPSNYNITIGGLAYVMVNGAQSSTQVWPTYSAPSSSTGVAGLSLSQNNIIITAGQSTIVSAFGNNGSLGTLTVASNVSSSVAAGTVSGSQVTVIGYTSGTTAMTICASSVGCATLYVTVQSSSSASNSTTQTGSGVISISPTSLTLQIGENRTVAMSGSNSYYISTHSNPVPVSTSINGAVLSLHALAAGTDNMSVCGTSGNTTSCVTLNAIVTQSSANSTNTGAQGTITFSNNNLSLNLGETKTVTVTGSGLGGYYISANSNADLVGANLSGSVVTLMGNAVGGANVTVCQFAGACGNVYAYASASGGTSVTTNTANISQPPALAAFSIASNNVGNSFMGSGAALTFTVNANQSVNPPLIVVAGQTLPVYGSGSGPYTALYTLVGNESVPISVSVTLKNANDLSSQAQFTLGGAPSGSIGSSVTEAISSFNNGSVIFTKLLEIGSTGTEVTALQTRLTALGFYSGPITGKYGALTETAVKRYQAKHGLQQAGVVGPSTRAFLNKGV